MTSGDGSTAARVDRESGPSTITSVFVATSECRGCGACLSTCPERALRPADPAHGGPPLLTLVGRCTGCGECMEICPVDAFVEIAWPA